MFVSLSCVLRRKLPALVLGAKMVLLIALDIALLLLLVMTAFMWYRSLGTMDFVEIKYMQEPIEPFHRARWTFESVAGGVSLWRGREGPFVGEEAPPSFVRSDATSEYHSWERRHSDAYPTRPFLVPCYVNFLGIQIGEYHAPPSPSPFYPTVFDDAVSVTMPYWLLALLFATPLILLIVGPQRSWLRAARRKKLGLCLHCGYDLRGTTGRCPECGTHRPTAPNMVSQASNGSDTKKA
jgi:hypothetical protein